MRRFAYVLVSLLLPAIARATAGPLSFIENDFAHARAQATQRKLPIFVEVWAPW